MKTFTAEEMRELDRKAIEEYGIPGIVLMENAGRGAAEIAFDMLLDAKEDMPVVVCCGPGNNGGDGFVVARHLMNWEYDVRCFLVGTKEKVKPGDAATNMRIAETMNIPIEEITGPNGIESAASAITSAALIVDAIFGTGLGREVGGTYRELIEEINASGKPVLALDVPSGLCSDRGIPLGVAVKAAATATFGAIKTGLAADGAERYTGEIHLVEISIPHFLFD